ncbi:MAG: AbgT family transporter [Phycisphaerales bacterium]|nr:AbgT family transporter [Phycisphaerales bacterium]
MSPKSAPPVLPRPPASTVSGDKPRGWFARFLNAVEWLGNLLPHPVTLFAGICVLIVLVSGVAAAFGVQVQDPRNPGAVIRAVSLLNGEGLRRMIREVVRNFVEFAPLGTVLVAMLGVGVAEKSGLLSAAIRALVLSAPRPLVTAAIVFAGVLSNTASEMGYVVLIPLAAAIYLALGRHPLVGLAAAFAGVSGGYSANLLLGTIDPLLAGITTEAARFLDPTYEVNPAANWYFMQASVFMITGIGTFVTEKIVAPRLGTYDRTAAAVDLSTLGGLDRLRPEERRGLLWAGVAVVVLAGIVALGVVPERGVLRAPVETVGAAVQEPEAKTEPRAAAALEAELSAEEGIRLPSIYESALFKGIVAFILLFFIVPGIVYGAIVGTIRNDRDVIDAMADALSRLGLYLVLVFFAAQFVKYFDWTNLGLIIAVEGAVLLRQTGLDNAAVFVPFILMCCLVNLMLGSASAQWAVTAPIFVPMLMTVGYSPEVVQAAYRIGDSTTNIITPMMSYFGLILAFAARYDRRIGIGTLVSTMLPYSLLFLVGWIALFYLWVFLLGLPVGPGSPTYLPTGP